MEMCAKNSPPSFKCKSADRFRGAQQGFSSPSMPPCSFNTIQAKLEEGMGRGVGVGGRVTEEEKEAGRVNREGAGV